MLLKNFASVLIAGGSAIYLLTGCAVNQLQANTLDLSGSISSFEKDQIANNLLAFLKNPSTIPSQLVLTGGSVQVANQVSPSISLSLFQWAHGSGMHSATIGGQNQWTMNWSTAPVTDSDDLRRLRALYRKALAVPASDFDAEYPVARMKNAQGEYVSSCISDAPRQQKININTYSARVIADLQQIQDLSARIDDPNHGVSAQLTRAEAKLITDEAALRGAQLDAANPPQAEITCASWPPRYDPNAVSSTGRKESVNKPPVGWLKVEFTGNKSAAAPAAWVQMLASPKACTKDELIPIGASANWKLSACPEQFSQFVLWIMAATPNTSGSPGSGGGSPGGASAAGGGAGKPQASILLNAIQ